MICDLGDRGGTHCCEIFGAEARDVLGEGCPAAGVVDSVEVFGEGGGVEGGDGYFFRHLSWIRDSVRYEETL